MREAYNAQLAEPGYARVLRRAEVIGTYDDHDYGLNNAGKEWEHKRLAARLTLDFLGEPRGSDRRARGARSGIYESYVYGEPGRRARVVLLDTRFERDPLPPLSDVLGANGRIRTHADMLGEEQWRWLERTLAEGPRAELTILASSVPILPALSAFALGWSDIEGFHRFPASRQRLLRLLSSTNTTGVVMLGGDYHFALIDEWDARCTPLGYPLIDLVSSGLTHAADDSLPFWGAAPSYDLAAPNGVVHFGLAGVPFERDLFLEKNWGMVEVDWDAPGGARVHLSVRDVRGAPVLQRSVRLAELAPPAGFDARASWDLMGGRWEALRARARARACDRASQRGVLTRAELLNLAWPPQVRLDDRALRARRGHLGLAHGGTSRVHRRRRAGGGRDGDSRQVRSGAPARCRRARGPASGARTDCASTQARLTRHTSTCSLPKRNIDHSFHIRPLATPRGGCAGV